MRVELLLRGSPAVKQSARPKNPRAQQGPHRSDLVGIPAVDGHLELAEEGQQISLVAIAGRRLANTTSVDH